LSFFSILMNFLFNFEMGKLFEDLQDEKSNQRKLS